MGGQHFLCGRQHRGSFDVICAALKSEGFFMCLFIIIFFFLAPVFAVVVITCCLLIGLIVCD